MAVTKTTLPVNSILYDKKYDYVDSFQGTFADRENKLKPIDVCKAFFSSSPTWVGVLFAARNVLVSVFGLKTHGENGSRQQIENFQCEPGEQHGLFKVFDRNEREAILGTDDTHLNFRVSLLLDKAHHDTGKRNLTITTTVEFNNRWGRLYFVPVRPFHQLIVPAMLKRVIKTLEMKI